MSTHNHLLCFIQVLCKVQLQNSQQKHSYKIICQVSQPFTNRLHSVKFNCFSLFKPDGTDLFNFVHGYPSWAAYLRSMEMDGTWGDHLILCAAAKCYKTPIRVISSLDCDVIINPDHLVDNTSPLVLGHIHEKHYVSLQCRQGKV